MTLCQRDPADRIEHHGYVRRMQTPIAADVTSACLPSCWPDGADAKEKLSWKMWQ